MNKEQILHFQKNILDWYDDTARVLPWRKNPSPYRVWISEIMLQQTKVEAVIPYFERFMEVYPTVFQLAQAEEDELFKIWQGLGYYQRAKNLKIAAQEIVSTHHGIIPKHFEELVKLKGIGSYTAGAIASIAYQQPTVAVDGNVLRVLARIIGCFGAIDDSKTKIEIETHAKNILDKQRPGDFNQALMELGATICIPNGAPKCHLCPVQQYCYAYQTNNTSIIPQKKSKKERKIEKKTIIIHIIDDKIAIRKRNNKGLLANVYEPIVLDDHISFDAVKFYFSKHAEITEVLPSTNHIFSHVVWEMIGYVVCNGEPIVGYDYVSKEDLYKNRSIPKAFQHYLIPLIEEMEDENGL